MAAESAEQFIILDVFVLKFGPSDASCCNHEFENLRETSDTLHTASVGPVWGQEDEGCYRFRHAAVIEMYIVLL